MVTEVFGVDVVAETTVVVEIIPRILYKCKQRGFASLNKNKKTVHTVNRAGTFSAEVPSAMEETRKATKKKR